MKVVVIGTGYVGLVSATCLAAKGHDVIGVDTNKSVVDQLNSGEPHIHERGLPRLLGQAVAQGRIAFTHDLSDALDQAELVLIAVGTPSKDGKIDLSYIRLVSRQIGEYLRDSDRHLSIVVKSTVVPGTTDTVVKDEVEAASGKAFPAFGLGMNPEFLREGEAVDDFMEPDRIVFGHEDGKTLSLLEDLYKPWSCDKVAVNTRTAELIKYSNNALLATQISAMNEIANLAAALGGIDMLDVVQGVQLDKRWSPIVDGTRIEPGILSYHTPGCGFGGSCFPKDVEALRYQGEQLGLEMRMLNGVLDINREQPGQVTEIIERRVGSLNGKTVLVLGLAFKPGTDDVRESASLRIVADLMSRGATVLAHDPIATENFQASFGTADGAPEYIDDWHSAVIRADIVVVATSWPEYSALVEQGLKNTIMFDARRLFDKADFEAGSYLSIGLSE